jgi:hypothetical protein
MSTREKKDSDLSPCGTERTVTLLPDPCSSVAPDTAAPEEKFSSEGRASLHFPSVSRSVCGGITVTTSRGPFCISAFPRSLHPRPPRASPFQVRPLIPRCAPAESPICTPRLVPAGRCSWATTGGRELHRPSFAPAHSRGLHRAGHSSWQASCRRWDGDRDAMCPCDWWFPVSAAAQP